MSRLTEPISISKLTKDQAVEFGNATDEECDEKGQTDLMPAWSRYSYDQIEPYILNKIEIGSDNEADEVDPIILPFFAYQKKMESITNDGKVKKLLEKRGMGRTVKEIGQCVVFVHFSVYTDYMECPYDVSRLREKKPTAFRLGYDSMIEGMFIGVQTMKKGEKSKFLIDPDYAFGELGVLPLIKPNATLLIDIELVDFTNDEDVIALHGKDDDEVQAKRTFVETMRCAETLNIRGNNKRKNDLNEAIREYGRAIHLLVDFHYGNERDENKARELMLKLYTNLCICYNMKKSYKQTCAAYNNARHDCPGLTEKYPKILYHSAKAVRNLGDYKEAIARLGLALKIKRYDEEILEELNLAIKERAEQEKKEKNMYRSMFGFSKTESREEEDEFNKKMNAVKKEFQEMFISLLNTLKESDQDSMEFSFGATSMEKDLCKELCKKHNMSFRVTKTDGVEMFIVTKKPSGPGPYKK